MHYSFDLHFSSNEFPEHLFTCLSPLFVLVHGETDTGGDTKKKALEGNGTPLQYPCLENPMNRGAWCAAVHGVARSRTRLSDFTFTFHFHALEKEMATHSGVLAWRIPDRWSLVGCRLWGHTELDTTDATLQQQQQNILVGKKKGPNGGSLTEGLGETGSTYQRMLQGLQRGNTEF